MKQVGRFALLAAVATMSLMGCSSGESAVDSLSTTAPTSRYPVGEEWRYSFDWASPQAYYKSSYDLYQSAISACMRAAGFSYEPVAYVDSDAIYASLNPLNEEIASTYGYSSPPDAEIEDPNSGDDAYYQALTDPDGCSNIALTYAYDGEAQSAWSDQFDPLLADADRAILGFESTDRGVQLLEEWSGCMAQKGYDYQTPGDAASTMPDEVNDLSLRVRLADLACDREVGLTRERSLFEQQAIQAWADRNALAIEELESALRAAQLEVASRREALATNGASALESVEPFRQSGEQTPTG